MKILNIKQYIRTNLRKLSNIHDNLETSANLISAFSQNFKFISNENQFQDSVEIHNLQKYYQGMWLPNLESRFQLWMVDGEYQKMLYERALMYINEKHVAIDVGANVGFFSKNMSNDFNVVNSFEPVQFNRACLARNVCNKCVIWPYGLSSNSGNSIITVNPIACGGAEINSRNNKLYCVNSIDYKIELKTLDSFKFKDVSLIKIDVQGFEKNVILGSLETISKYKPVIIYEMDVHGDKNEGVFELLKDYGYKIVEKLNSDVICCT